MSWFEKIVSGIAGFTFDTTPVLRSSRPERKRASYGLPLTFQDTADHMAHLGLKTQIRLARDGRDEIRYAGRTSRVVVQNLLGDFVDGNAIGLETGTGRDEY